MKTWLEKLASSEFLTAVLLGGVGAYLFITILLLMDWYDDFQAWLSEVF